MAKQLPCRMLSLVNDFDDASRVNFVEPPFTPYSLPTILQWAV